MRRRLAPLVLLVALVGAACSGSSNNKSDPTTVKSDTTAWNPARVTELKAVAARLEKGIPGECAKLEMFQPAAYLPQAGKFGPIPEAAAACDALTERLEFVAQGAGTTPAKFVTARADNLCKKAATIKVDLPGLYWVLGPDWTIQPDSEGVARRIAPFVGGTYRATACPGQQAGWTHAGVVAFQDLTAKLHQAGLGCNDAQLRDRDLVSHNPAYERLGLPAAMGECTLINDAKTNDDKLVLAIFDGAKPKPDDFVTGELGFECAQQPATRVVRTANGAVFAPNAAAATKVAGALGGPVDGEVCN